MTSLVYEPLPIISGLSSPVVSVAVADASRVFLSCEDGSLRVFATRDDPLASARPVFTLTESIVRFTRDRKPAKNLMAVQKWRALFSLSDGALSVHDIDGLSSGGFLFPGSVGCRSFCVSHDAGLLCVVYATSAIVFSWVGDDNAPPTAASFSRVAEHSLSVDISSSAASIVRANFIGSATLCFAVVHASSKDPKLLIIDSEKKQKDDRAAPFLDFADVFSPFGGSGGGGSNSSNVGNSAGGEVFGDGDGDAMIANSDHENSSLTTGVSTGVPLSRETTSPSFAAARESLPNSISPQQGAHDAGARLSFLVVHAWAGTVLRILSAGLAPALDASGSLCINSQQLIGTPCADISGNAVIAAVNGSALLASVGVQSDTFRRSPFWGTIGVIEGGGALLSTALPTAGDASTASLAFSIDSFGRVQTNARGVVADAANNTIFTNENNDTTASESNNNNLSSEDELRNSLHILLHQEHGASVTAGTGGAPLILLESHPIEIASSPLYPYVISAHSNGLHVHSARTGALLQSVRLQGGLALATAAPSSDGESYFFASGAGVVLLRSLPSVVQAAALLSARPPHYEEALALCGDASSIDSSSSSIDDDNNNNFESSGLAALARKVQSIRRQYGYALWSLGDFAAGLAQLSLAREPVSNVIALFPKLHPVGPFAASLGSSLIAASSIPAVLHSGNTDAAFGQTPPPELIDALLPPALAPLVRFLASEREHTGGAAVDVDLRLLEAMLWLRNHWFTRAGSLLVRDSEGSRIATATSERYANTIRALLAVAHTLDVTTVTALVHSYSAVLGIAGASFAESDLVSLWRGRKSFIEAARVLARSANEAQTVGESVGFLRTLTNGMSSLAARAPITTRISLLFSFIARYGYDDISLLRAYVVPGLSGSFGTEGVLFSLAAVMALTEHTQFTKLTIEDIFKLLASVHELMSPMNAILAQPEFWLLSGVSNIRLERGITRGHTIINAHLPLISKLWQFFLSQKNTDKLEILHATACTDDTIRLGSPQNGWTRHIAIALLENLVLSASARNSLVGPRVTDALASAYISVLREVGAREMRQVDECGLAREYRERLTRLLLGSEVLYAVQVLAALWAVSPAPSFSDERVILFERLGRHDDALSIIIRDLYDFDKAEAYCTRVDAREPTAKVFSTLLKVSSGIGMSSSTDRKVDTTATFVLNEIDGEDDGTRLLRTRSSEERDLEPFLMGSTLSRLTDGSTAKAIASAAAVHVRSHSSQSAGDALVLLPVATPLAAIASLLEAVSRASCDAVAGAAAARAVAGVTRARVLAEAVTSETRGIQIDKASACAVCKRRVGAMQPSTLGGLSLRPLPFLVYPNGLVCHQTCAV